MYLRSLAEPALRGSPLLAPEKTDARTTREFIENFADERGHRRRVDRAVLAWCLREHRFAVPTSTDSQSPEIILWHALATNADPPAWSLAGDGPLCPHTHSGAIEAWTQTELACLHALGNFALRGDSLSHAANARAISLARWLLEEVQPDNATQHPWAVHVFVALSQTESPFAADAGLYAQQLVHNAVVSAGVPDRFSAVLLLDAARALHTQAVRPQGRTPIP